MTTTEITIRAVPVQRVYSPQKWGDDPSKTVTIKILDQESLKDFLTMMQDICLGDVVVEHFKFDSLPEVK